VSNAEKQPTGHGPEGCAENGPAAALLVSYVSIQICALLAPCRRPILIATKAMLFMGQDTRIRKYYCSLIQKLIEQPKLPGLVDSLAARWENQPLIRTSNRELPVRSIASDCLYKYSVAKWELLSSFFAKLATCWGERGRRIGMTRSSAPSDRLPNFLARHLLSLSRCGVRAAFKKHFGNQLRRSTLLG
jgi:hypothetical protein